MSVCDLDIIPLELIEDAKERLKGVAVRTPLIPLNVPVEGKKIYLKLENLQPIGSFKLRGAYNAMMTCDQDLAQHGVLTASAGNFAQGVAWSAGVLGYSSNIVVPDNAPETKVSAIKRLGGHVIKVPYSDWWDVMVTQKYEHASGYFIHPLCDKLVIAGNGTIGLEILEDLPEVDTIIGPFGGGGHLCGIASAVKHSKPEVKVVASEVETAAPLTASFHRGEPTTLTDHRTSFVDGMGGKSVFGDMWRLARGVINDTVVLSVAEIAAAVRTLAERNRVVAEGAGAAPVAAALRDEVQPGNIVCVVSGGNIDSAVLANILQGNVPH